MRTKLQRIQYLLAIGISLVVAAYPVYLQYNSFMEIDFLSPHPSFENLDQDNLLADEQSKIKIFVLNPSPEVFQPGFLIEEQLPSPSFQVFSLLEPAAILRC